MDVTSSMKLKVKRDTFFLPEHTRGVYFRNTSSSFRMEGTTIAQWVETLLPMFNGEHTLGELTAGLPSTYKNMVMDIADVLYKNEFVRDMSQERPHQLKEEVLLKHASQIQFLENMIDSGSYHFQLYRQKKVLAVGSGHLFVSLVSALLDSGLPAFHTFITETVPTNKKRLNELVKHAAKADTEIKIEDISRNFEENRSWRELVRPFDAILYVSQEGEGEELNSLLAACKEEKKMFFPAFILNQTGIAGPIATQESVVSWDSAKRQLHQSVLSTEPGVSAFSVTAGAMLANILAFELFKELTGVTQPEETNQFYLLDLETLEGKWHSCLPHPLVTGQAKMKWVEDADERFGNRQTRTEEGNLFLLFSRLTSPQSGIFHSWEEGELEQLPLAQCRVQVVNPLSKGFTDLLPEIICSDLTHKEARREAGLSGIERYSAEMFKQLNPALSSEEFLGIGTGETFAECVCRGLQKWLNVEFTKHAYGQKNQADTVVLDKVEDERCDYYLQALTTIAGTPKIARGKNVSGFPVIWVNTGDKWYGSAGVTLTIALRYALQQALMKYQNNTSQMAGLVRVEEKEPQKLMIPVCDTNSHFEDLQKAKKILAQNQKQMVILELEWEPLKKELAGVLGVTVREEEFG